MATRTSKHTILAAKSGAFGLILAVSMFVFCPGPVFAQSPTEPPPDPQTNAEEKTENERPTPDLKIPSVRDIRVRIVPEGLGPKLVRDRIHLKKDGPLDPGVVSEDLRRIFGLGFFEDIQVSIEESDQGATITYHVLQRPVVQSVKIEGMDLGDDKDKEFNNKAKALASRFYNPAKIQQIAQGIRSAYAQEGHHFVDVDVKMRKLTANRVAVLIKVEAHEKLTIRRIEIIGNSVITDEEIINFLANREGDALSFMSGMGTYQRTLLFQRDVEVIKQIYASRGYVYAQVSTPEVTVLPDRSGINITMRLSEGKRFKVSGVTIKGDLIAPEKELIALSRLKKGEVFNLKILIDDIRRLSTYYRDRGYAFADANYVYHPNPKTQTLGVEYRIQKGSLIRVGTIEMTGNRRTLDDVIRREFKLNEGDLFSETKLNRSKMQVQRTGYFESVQVRKQPRRRADGDYVLDIEIHVRERRTGSFQLGLGFSSFESFMFNGQIQEQNFLGRGQSLTFNAMFSQLRTIFQLQFHEPYFLDSQVGFGFNAYNLREYFRSFERQRQGGSLTWSYRLTDDLTASSTYRLEHASAFLGGDSGRLTVPVAQADREGWTSSIALRLAYDTRDNRMIPKRGQYSMMSYERADTLLGSTSNFDRITLQSRWYFPFLLGTTLKLNGLYAIITTDDPEGVPTYERYFAGGIFDIRGFQRYSLGPSLQVGSIRDPGTTLQNFFIGGNKKLVLNAEIEIPIIEAARISAILFFDMGNAFGEKEFPDLYNIRKSVGFGFRWWAPIGPLRFEWGFPLDRRPGEESMVFEFTIGSMY